MPSILVVDDSKIDRLLIGNLLSKNPCWEIAYAENGEEAIEKIRVDSFDLIVTDLQMPRVDGLGLVRFVRQEKPELPVLLVTSRGSDDIAVEALRLGATHYSSKTKLNKDLYDTAKQVLEFSKRLHKARSLEEQKDIFNFVLENDTQMISPMIAMLESYLPDWTEADRLRIGMAINEAVSNAIYHGNLEVASELKEEDEGAFFELVDVRKNMLPYSGRRVRVEAQYLPDEIRVKVCDQGPGFNPDSVADPTRAENLERLSGRGLLLIRSFMDQVEHNSTGNEISMVKRRIR